MSDKKVAIVNSNNKRIISALEFSLGNSGKLVEIEDDLTLYDLIVLTGYKTQLSNFPENKEVLNLHPSLLPAFQVQDTIKTVYLSGVKVSGVTVHRVENGNFFGKIYAQYPVLLGLETRLDEFTRETEMVAARLYPAVVKALLDNRVFDFQDLFKNPCNHQFGTCGGNCSNCRH